MKPLVILSGPTSVGKTKLSLQLAKAINGEIISADSMQVYRFMDIGTAKIRPEEMDGVVHHLIDCLLPTEAFSVASFQSMAKDALQGIYERGHIPIVVGGTGFYIQALLYDIHFEEEAPSAYRLLLEERARNGEKEALHAELMKVDPASASAIPMNNVKRVIRALEYYEVHKSLISQHNKTERERTSPYNFAYFVLTRDREELYAQIDSRVDSMLEAGLIEEVKSLVSQGYDAGTVAMQGLGYKQMLDFFAGKSTQEEAVARTKQETRHFAKRQLTWFRRERDVCWFNKSEKSETDILEEMLTILRKKKIL